MTYEGNEKYIFVSYSHKDSDTVLPLIDTLKENGFRVWFDAGIEAGTEWPEYIEDHIRGAEVVLVFMTPRTVESKNCRNEINFSLSIEKEVLVVYLEDTDLLKGMSLQLNSTQSLFRRNHPSHDSFLGELINARILQSCREGAVAAEAPAVKAKKPVSATRISNVCSIGANDENDLWPSGRYSQVINRDRFSVVFFHISLLRPFGFSGTVINKYQVYNSENNLIYEEENPLEVRPEYDRISKGWILRGGDGSFVPSGDYRYVCSINGSPTFSYNFTVCSDADQKPETPAKRSLMDRIKSFMR